METVALLMLELEMLRIAKARNANFETIAICERDIVERAKQVRARVWKAAFKALAENHKESR